MNPSSSQPTATATFVVRFWREWTGAEARWRGRIEHVQSGRRADFLVVDQMLAFLQQMGVTIAVHRPTQQISGDGTRPPAPPGRERR